MEHAVDVVNLKKSIGFWHKTALLHGVSFQVPAGQVFGLLGPNGAGKTTTFKLLLGLSRITSGTATLFGKPVPTPESREGVGFLPEVVLPPPYLTAREYLRFHARLLGIDAIDSAIDRAMRNLEVIGYADKPLGDCSKGMRQRIDLARLFLSKPRLILLDEPVSGLDPLGQSLLKDVLLKLKSEGLTILLNSHAIGMLADVCDAVAIMKEGRVLRTGSLSALLATNDSRIVIRHRGETPDIPDLGRPFTSRQMADGLLELTFPGVASPEDLVARLSAKNRDILEAGPVKSTLEHVFRAVVQSSTPTTPCGDGETKEVAA